MGDYRGKRKKGRPKKGASDGPGVYGYKNKETGEWDYIGESSNVKERDRKHQQNDAPFAGDEHEIHTKEYDGRSTSRTRRQDEADWIEKHDPEYNQRKGGAGRPANGGSGGGSA